MRILLTGASGFLGRHFGAALLARGHQLRCAQRGRVAEFAPYSAAEPAVEIIPADFSRDFAVADWSPRLQGIAVVINTVGIFRERGAQSFAALHTRAPQALFAACVEAGVERVIQISALGADEQAASSYHLSKKAADDFLLVLPIDAVVVQPSLVFGRDGASTGLFGALASLPLIPLPGAGLQQIQPLHIDDLTTAVVHLVEGAQSPRRLAAVGGQALTLRDYLATLRGALQLPKPMFLPLPRALMRAGALVPALRNFSSGEALAMLERGNSADAGEFARVLGAAPRPPVQFLTRAEGRDLRRQTALKLALPPLRLSLALLWLISGLVSLGIYPVSASLELLASTGAHGTAALALLYAGAVLDIALGIATLALRRRRLWAAQIAVVAVYTAIITVFLPQFWLHPYGPVLKNLPILAALLLLYLWEER